MKSHTTAYCEWWDVLVFVIITHEKSACLFVNKNVKSICGARLEMCQEMIVGGCVKVSMCGCNCNVCSHITPMATDATNFQESFM